MSAFYSRKSVPYRAISTCHVKRLSVERLPAGRQGFHPVATEAASRDCVKFLPSLMAVPSDDASVGTERSSFNRQEFYLVLGVGFEPTKAQGHLISLIPLVSQRRGLSLLHRPNGR